jgi:hypothetical protein
MRSLTSVGSPKKDNRHLTPLLTVFCDVLVQKGERAVLFAPKLLEVRAIK